MDLERFCKERHDISKVLGEIPSELLKIDYRCPLWTPYATVWEQYLEFARGVKRLNTTMRGIGPMVALDAFRVGLRVSDLLDPTTFLEKIRLIHGVLTPIFACEGFKDELKEIPDPVTVSRELLAYGQKILPLICDTTTELRRNYLEKRQRILCEGAQAVGLDLRFGTYPYVSSGLTVAQAAPLGTGLPIKAFNLVVIVHKLFPSRVGEGWLPTELTSRDMAQQFPVDHPELFQEGPQRISFLERSRGEINEGRDGLDQATVQANYLQVLLREKGVATGRGRSLGNPDLHWMRYASHLSGADIVALTCLDAASGLKKISLAETYSHSFGPQKGMSVPSYSLPMMGLWDAVPHYKTLPGWEEDLTNCSTFESLPSNAKNLVIYMENAIGLPITFLGVGPRRGQLIVRD